MAKKTTERVIAVDTKGAENSIAALRVKIRELTDAQRELDVESAEFRDISTELTAAQTRLRNAMQGNTAAVEGSYKAYSHQLQVLKEHRKWLAEGTEEYRKATEEISKLDKKLKDMDAEIGVFGRNVGNYASAFEGLNGGVQQAAQNIPQLVNGSQNLFDVVKSSIPTIIKSAEGIGEVATQGGKAKAIIGALAKSIFSWQTLLVAGVALLAEFGEAILGVVKGLLGFGKETKKVAEQMTVAAQAARNFNDAFAEQQKNISEQIGRFKVLQLQWNGLGDSMSAKEKFIRSNTEAFKALGIEIRNVAEAEKFLVNNEGAFLASLIARSKAVAAQKVADELYEEILRLEINVMDNPTFGPEFKSQFERDKIRPLRQQWSTYIGKVIEYRNEGAQTLDNAGLKGAGDDVGKVVPGKFMPSSPGKVTAYALGGNAVDQGAAIEAAKVRAAAMSSIAEASAEERKAIEQQLVEDLAFIEQMRLETHEMLINEMLRSDEITADQRLALEEQLSENIAAQAELRAEAAERAADRGAKAAQKQAEAEKKAAKEAEDAEKKKQKCKEQILNNTASLLKSAADMAKENSAEQKMLNAASVVMDTISASVKAWKWGLEMGGPAMAIFNTAATVAMGGAQLKALMSVNPDGSNAETALSSAQVPNVASTMPASYTRNLMGNNELSELNKDIRVYVVEQDITDAQNASKARVESASF